MKIDNLFGNFEFRLFHKNINQNYIVIVILYLLDIFLSFLRFLNLIDDRFPSICLQDFYLSVLYQ